MDLLKNARIKKNLTQAQVAKKLKMSKSNYCNIENGVRGISLLKGIELSKILDIPLEKIKKFTIEVHKMKTNS
jgi:transcriptional regulator with XRE-family HTH domain